MDNFNQDIVKNIVSNLLPDNSLIDIDTLLKMQNDLQPFQDFINRYPDVETEVYKSLIRLIKNIYVGMPSSFASEYRRMCIEIFTQDIAVNIIEKTNFDVYKEFYEITMKLFNKHSKEFIGMIDNIFKSASKSYGNDIFVSSNIILNDKDKYDKVTSVIKINNIDPDFRLYHGTSIGNYRKILKDGVIKRSNYKKVDFGNLDNISKMYKYMESKYLFLASDIDKSLGYSLGGYRKNNFDLGGREYFEVLNEKIFNSEGVIFKINPQNYNVFYFPSRNEFLINSDVKVEDTEMIFVHLKDGKITIDKEVNYNELCD